MFSADQYVIEFVKQNTISLYMLVTFLKGIAIVTPSTKDNKIVTLIGNIFKAAKRGSLSQEELDQEFKQEKLDERAKQEALSMEFKQSDLDRQAKQENFDKDVKKDVE